MLIKHPLYHIGNIHISYRAYIIGYMICENFHKGTNQSYILRTIIRMHSVSFAALKKTLKTRTRAHNRIRTKHEIM